MGRVYTELRENGRCLWALFDTGSKNTYIVRSALGQLPTQTLANPFQVGLGGKNRTADRMCNLEGFVEGRRVAVQAFVIDELGRDEKGRAIELLFGALAMQQWNIRVIPDEERLDLTHYPEEFIEY